MEYPPPKHHNWAIEPREYARQEERRGRRHAFERIAPARTALVVIDMVPFFLEQNGYCRGIVPNILRIADCLRAAGGVVSWIVPAPEHRHPALAEEFFGKDIAELFRASGGSGPIAERLWPALRPEAGDLLFEKNAYSAFYPGASPLPAALRDRGMENVVITGAVTNICCESSARDAFASGFRVIVVGDATAARRDQDHNAALHNIYRSFGDVRSTDDVVALIDRA
ncbi:isochorismatase family cysteine hydrolase [Sinorhizobium sp. 8-89]|uniref:isochorismatase family cysteine hydrolase n=1 Tax=Sinorhizobium sp. 7-81 TaxID=3049087 RepID=UPI0024C4111B|nr:isochorismatase family cysteine hydrolase [Sinorhizobium sp. 7-81]MDK1388563.1 isochorismatase family cysteine hydrolase [Sinorhizobium sp. 7-81]